MNESFSGSLRLVPGMRRASPPSFQANEVEIVEVDREAVEASSKTYWNFDPQISNLMPSVEFFSHDHIRMASSDAGRRRVVSASVFEATVKVSWLRQLDTWRVLDRIGVLEERVKQLADIVALHDRGRSQLRLPGAQLDADTLNAIADGEVSRDVSADFLLSCSRSEDPELRAASARALVAVFPSVAATHLPSVIDAESNSFAKAIMKTALGELA